jgi:hypothetical protein
MAAAKNELASFDDGWEEPPATAQGQPVAVSSIPPDLGDLDDGWNADPLAAAPGAESTRDAQRAGVPQETVPAPSVPWLTKRQRRGLAKQQRRHATQRRAERKQARKLERREQAKQRVAVYPPAEVPRVAAKGTQAARQCAAPGATAPQTSGDAGRPPPSASGTARPERGARPQRSGPPKPQREAERRGTLRAPFHAVRQRKMSRVLYLVVAVVVAALGAFAWLR